MLSGSLASPKPAASGEPEEHGDDENETQSRGGIQGPGGLECVPGRQDAGRIAERFHVHPTQITEWKQQLLAQAVDVFGGATPTADMPDLKVLHAKIGRLALENDFLEGALIKAGLLSAKR